MTETQVYPARLVSVLCHICISNSLILIPTNYLLAYYLKNLIPTLSFIIYFSRFLPLSRSTPSPPIVFAMSGGTSISRGNTLHFGSNAGSAAPSTQHLKFAYVLRIQQDLSTLLRDAVHIIHVEPDDWDLKNISTLFVGPLETP